MKVICDCGAEIYNQGTPPIGSQPGHPEVTFKTSTALWCHVSKERTAPQRLLQMECGECGRTFITVDVVP